MGSVRSGVSGAATTDGASSAAPEVADLPPHLHPFSMSGAALSAGSVAAGVRPGAHPLARQPSQGMAQEAGARRFHDDHSSTSSSRATYSHGAEELGGMSGTGQLSLGNSTLRPATMIKNSNSGGNLPDLASTASNGTLSILLVEDNAINMKVALGILRRFGQNEVKTAYDGQQALRTVDANGGADAFHLILMDLHMPVMGGMEALREFKTRYPCSTTKVVAVTADAFEVTRDECMSAGFDGWLPKPFRLEDMVRIIGENVGGSASNNPSAAPTNKSGKL
uniref:Response regulatory domain-containing protein n=1 Tax=Chlamydomonas euryale TaxID=1486919 RepID=A0A7R9YX24_9CHLO